MHSRDLKRECTNVPQECWISARSIYFRLRVDFSRLTDIVQLPAIFLFCPRQNDAHVREKSHLPSVFRRGLRQAIRVSPWLIEIYLHSDAARRGNRSEIFVKTMIDRKSFWYLCKSIPIMSGLIITIILFFEARLACWLRMDIVYNIYNNFIYILGLIAPVLIWL